MDRAMTAAERQLLLAIAAMVVQLADSNGTLTSADGRTIDARAIHHLADKVRAQTSHAPPAPEDAP
jgi:hypothetical protein